MGRGLERTGRERVSRSADVVRRLGRTDPDEARHRQCRERSAGFETLGTTPKRTRTNLSVSLASRLMKILSCCTKGYYGRRGAIDPTHVAFTGGLRAIGHDVEH